MISNVVFAIIISRFKSATEHSLRIIKRISLSATVCCLHNKSCLRLLKYGLHCNWKLSSVLPICTQINVWSCRKFKSGSVGG